MILFWLCALVLIAVALAFVLPPLLGTGRTSAAAQSESPSLELYHSRVAALEEQCRIGALGEDDLAEARDELARELLADTSSQSSRALARGNAASRARGPWLALAVGVGVPLFCIALYQHLGEPGAIDPPQIVAGTGSNPAAGVAEVEQMVARLAERLQSEADDGEGWLLLARSYMTLERYPKATEAYAAAHRLLGDSAALLSDLAEAQALSEQQNFLGSPGEYLERALSLEPEYPKALWLGAFAAMQRGQPALAASRWQALLARQPPDSEAAQILRGLIANAGIGVDTPGAGADGVAAGSGPALTVSVMLADRLAAGLDGSETLFVFARAAEGPPMPLAVARRRSSDLPLTVTLDDSMAMAPNMKLSDFARVVVGARISMSGTAAAASGDLQGFSKPVSVADDARVNLVISERVP